jgi:histidyl-tRNA synthetase
LDAEIIGTDAPAADVELLVLADQLLNELGIADGITLQLNTLGDAATREAWRAALVAHFEAHRGDLSEDSLARLDKNPLRILDSKDPRDRPIADSAPDIDAFLTSEASDFFAAVTAGLDAAGVAWTRNARLVRGIDYYTRTIFTFDCDVLGAQSEVGGGGRYDGLVEQLGGPATPAIGWAAGIERILLALDEEGEAAGRDAVVAIADPSQRQRAMALATELRHAGLSAEVDLAGRGLKGQLKHANRIGARQVLILEADGSAQLRDMASGEQRPADTANLVDEMTGGES